MRYDGAASIATFGAKHKFIGNRQADRLPCASSGVLPIYADAGSSLSTTASMWSWQCKRDPTLMSYKLMRNI